jgi:hypothetical protein
MSFSGKSRRLMGATAAGILAALSMLSIAQSGEVAGGEEDGVEEGSMERER